MGSWGRDREVPPYKLGWSKSSPAGVQTGPWGPFGLLGGRE
jgi:hypothetical protein